MAFFVRSTPYLARMESGRNSLAISTSHGPTKSRKAATTPPEPSSLWLRCWPLKHTSSATAGPVQSSTTMSLHVGITPSYTSRNSDASAFVKVHIFMALTVKLRLDNTASRMAGRDPALRACGFTRPQVTAPGAKVAVCANCRAGPKKKSPRKQQRGNYLSKGINSQEWQGEAQAQYPQKRTYNKLLDETSA